MSSKQNKKKESLEAEGLPVLPIEDTVIFPHTGFPVTVSGTEAAALAKHIKQDDTLIALTKKESAGAPNAENLHRTGTVCKIEKITPLPKGAFTLSLYGLHTATVTSLQKTGDSCIMAQTKDAPLTLPDSPEETQALVKATAKALRKLNRMGGHFPLSVIKSAEKGEEPPELLAYVAGTFIHGFTLQEKQALLEKTNLQDLHETVLVKIATEQRKAELSEEIQERVSIKIAAQQEKYFVQEMIEELRKTYGLEENDLTALETQVRETPLSDEARKKAEKDLERLKNIDSTSPEKALLQTSLETLLGLPWGKAATVNADTAHAREVLDEDHYGLTKVKEKITGYLAVQNRLSRKNGGENRPAPQIMCLVGPPGIGKTSICQSVAKATNRPYIRLALGGVSDEAEIRGHRRTYIGAESGSVMTLLNKSGVRNPVFVLDEIDKLTPAGLHGDPAAALLELLDPAQNKTFRDRYLDVPFDMSDVLFIATANVRDNIPPALQDRMDTIFLGSYTEDEKLEIAKRHLVRKKMEATGLDESEFSITQDALLDLIRHYTMEAGVRGLERKIADVCTQAVIALETSPEKIEVTSENLEKFAGKRLIDPDASQNEDKVGMVKGLAWMETGGATLPIESIKLPGKGTPLTLTGNLGKVISESAQVAFSLAKKKVEETGQYKEALTGLDRSTIHLHMPEGAIPKDGPSAGTAMLTALFSVITGKKVRGDIAMTGEINFAGDVLPIGGLREKLTAAARAGCRTVLIPKKNEKDLDDVPEPIKKALEIIPVSKTDEVLQHAIVGHKRLGFA